jgi:hypothetical protein
MSIVDELSQTYFFNSHFKSGFDEFFSPSPENAHFHYITIGKLEQLPLAPIEEAKRAARLISEKLQDPVLCLSGGLDSEAMAIAFLQEGIKFRGAIMNMQNGLNEYDIQAAKEFCKAHNVEFEEIHIPAMDILLSGAHLEIAEKYRTLSPERALFILFLEKISGQPVIGGEILRREAINGDVNFCCPKDRDLSYWRYLQLNERAGVPYFHYYTPELTLSFMAHTKISDPDLEVTDWRGRFADFYNHKLSVYREGGFEIADTDLRLQKWHGFEGLKMNFDSKHNSTNAYNRSFREPLEENPVYDLNQILLIEEDDEIARRILRY